MRSFMLAPFIVLHGLVHLWYFAAADAGGLAARYAVGR